MKVFQATRLKLTAWYLVIIMLVSVFFSVAFYNLSSREIQRVIRRVELRQALEKETVFFRPTLNPNPPNLNELEESNQRLIVMLVFINLGIFAAAGIGGYFLAGRTLKPIQTMVDEQNRFITDASHELRTPLTALRAEMEASLLDRGEVKNARKIITSNLEEVVKLQTLSDSLLGLAQDFNLKKTFFTKVSVQKIANDAIKKVGPTARRRHIFIESRISNKLINCWEAKLTQLFVILLDNAIKYSPKGSRIYVSSKKVDHFIKVVVKDSGIGIGEKDLSHVFDRFYRADASRTKISGYGLGLSIAKKIVEDHKGKISLESKLGKGSTFTVQLPI